MPKKVVTIKNSKTVQKLRKSNGLLKSKLTALKIQNKEKVKDLKEKKCPKIRDSLLVRRLQRSNGLFKSIITALKLTVKETKKKKHRRSSDWNADVKEAYRSGRYPSLIAASQGLKGTRPQRRPPLPPIISIFRSVPEPPPPPPRRERTVPQVIQYRRPPSVSIRRG